MKYIKFTYVDAQTGISIAAEPAANGPKLPPVVGLQFVWARESAYPTDVPHFFGTCPDGSDTQVDGVLGIFSQADWEQMQADEMNARPKPVSQTVAALTKIDTDTDKLYGDVLGNRAEEYALAESSAQAYKAAGCSGIAPSSVQSWATAKGWTATQATDDILTTAAAWRGAQAAIRAARLARKEQVRAATDGAAITAAMTAWAGFVAYMRGQLGI